MFDYNRLLCAFETDIAQHSRFPSGAPLSSDMEPREVAIEMCRRSFYKKLSPLQSNKLADEKALDRFLQINSQPLFDFKRVAGCELDSRLFDYFRHHVERALSSGGEFSLDNVRESLAAGPGASLGTDNESFYTKYFTSQASVGSDELLARFRAAISDSEFWSNAELIRHKTFGTRVRSVNRLFFAPKNAEISRVCCTEPSINMLIQKAIGTYLETCLGRYFGISLSTQPDINREFARIGSIDGSYGTIDLQSASDSIWLSLVERVIPSPLIGWLKMSRSERTILPDGSERELNMVSTMGNGFTFPLQTLLFACAVRAVYDLLDIRSTSRKGLEFCVFGDDIIVRSDAYHLTLRILDLLGFIVNIDKSFDSGPFRESCGADWFRGFFVRGVYLRSLESPQQRYSAVNRLLRWAAYWKLILPNTCRILLESLPWKNSMVPPSESDDAGLHVPFDMTTPKLQANYWFKYRKFSPAAKKRPCPLDREESKRLGYRHFNVDGLYVSFLEGFLKTPDFTVLEEVPRPVFGLRLLGPVRYRVRPASIPFWDWQGAEAGKPLRFYDLTSRKTQDDCFSFGGWKAAVAGSLT